MDFLSSVYSSNISKPRIGLFVVQGLYTKDFFYRTRASASKSITYLHIRKHADSKNIRIYANQTKIYDLWERENTWLLKILNLLIILCAIFIVIIKTNSKNSFIIYLMLVIHSILGNFRFFNGVTISSKICRISLHSYKHFTALLLTLFFYISINRIFLYIYFFFNILLRQNLKRRILSVGKYARWYIIWPPRLYLLQ